MDKIQDVKKTVTTLFSNVPFYLFYMLPLLFILTDMHYLLASGQNNRSKFRTVNASGLISYTVTLCKFDFYFC